MICVSSVNVSPSSVSIVKGSWYYNLGATVYPTNATCNEIRWYSNNTSVASVNASTGYVYGVEPGTAIIYAVATDGSGATDYCTVTVTDKIYVSSVSLDRTSLTLEKDTGYSLQASVYPWNADNRSLSWNSNNSAVATVSSGFVCARLRGHATITATATDGSGVSASCYVTVTDDISVTLIEINRTYVNMDIGKNVYLSAAVFPDNASNDGVVWSSSNSSVATVDSETGKVTAVAPGNAVIYATAKDGSGVYDTCNVTVNQYVYVDLVEITPPNRKLKVSDTGQLTATVCPENATNTSLIWHSSNPEVLEVGVYTGNYNAKTAGTSIVSATATDGSDKSASCIVTVEENPVTVVDCVTVSPENLTIYIGKPARLIADVCLASGTDDQVYWYSDDSTIVEVNSNTGEIIAKAEGTVRVWAVSAADNSKCAACEVTVVPIKVTAITLDRTTLELEKDTSRCLSATVSPTNATNDTVMWTSSDPKIAQVNSHGCVTAFSEGEAVITAMAADGSGKSSSCAVKVYSIPIESVSLSSKWLPLNIGDSGNMLSATVMPESATNNTVIWESSDKKIVSVNSHTGYIKAKAGGTAIITVKSAYDKNKSDSCKIVVGVPVESVNISTTWSTINVGETKHLTANILPANATNKEVFWRSSNQEVATIGFTQGDIKAKKAGTTIITAETADGHFTSSFEVWVKGKTPVFLLHGRISNSNATWGVKTNIPIGANNHFNPNIDAEFSSNKKYVDVDSQRIINVVQSDYSNDENPCNLGCELKNAGYEENVNMFVFNYPNEDAVIHSAKKFEKYIENLINYVKTEGTNEMKACFYASKAAYLSGDYRINIVGHSMGGLVARYYIENIKYENVEKNPGEYVDKLITICTPHLGSGYGNLSSATGIYHKLCDHDLRFDSTMFGGSDMEEVTCSRGTCPGNNYIISEKLQSDKERHTSYYAIAGIDYGATLIHLNDYSFEMPINFTTSQEIIDYLVGKGVYKTSGNKSRICIPPNPKEIGDNMVGFLSQIGWIGDNLDVPIPKPLIPMKKIFLDVDADGGNGNELFIWEAFKEWILDDVLLHSKIPHRKVVCKKIIEYLGE